MRPLLVNSLLVFCALFAHVAAVATTCTLTSVATIRVCALPWPRTPSAVPAVGTSVTVDVVAASSALSCVAASVNGVDVALSFASTGVGTYTLTYTTPEGGTEWPWRGLHVALTLQDGGGSPFSVAATVVPGASLEEDMVPRGLSQRRTSNRGLCVGDFDNDGDVDILFTHSGVACELAENAGGGTFAPAVQVGSNMNYHGCMFGDYDNDGDLDVFVSTRFGNTNELYLNQGSGLFVEGAADAGITAATDTLGAVVLDADGDGDLDLMIPNYNGAGQLYINDGAGNFVDEAGDRGVTASPSVTLQAVAFDVNGDSHVDILLCNAYTANLLFMNDGHGVFTNDPTRGFTDTDSCSAMTYGDLTGNGWNDVYISVHGARDLIYLFDEATGTFSEQGATFDASSANPGSYACLTFDIDMDGDLDVLSGVFGGADRVLVNAGGLLLDAAADLGMADGGSPEGIVAADFDGDGDIEAVVSRSGVLYVSHNAVGVGNWVAIRPLTAVGAQSAFGAAVRLTCVDGCGDGWVGLRTIDGGSGRFSQTGYDAHLSVPHPSSTYNASVRWPGDFHPPSNWTTHPRLGGIIPDTLPTPLDRLFVVRPAPLTATLGLFVWDYPGVGARSGLGAAPPQQGDTMPIPIVLSPAPHVEDVRVVSAAVDGVDVSGSWAEVGSGTFTVTHVTALGGEEWPWAGLTIELTLEDGGGLLSTFSTSAVPGSTWSEESDTRGMAAFQTALGRGVCMGDVDNDGDVDIFVGTVATPNQLWVNDGSGAFTDQATAVGVSGGDNAHGCGFGDADGDGWMDIILTRYSDDTLNLYVQQAGGTFMDEASSRGVVTPDGNEGDSLGAAWGDVDGDGDIDLFVCNWFTTPNMLFINDGSGGFAEDAAFRGAALAAMSSRQAAMVDIDGDGDLDVLVANLGADSLLVNAGDGSFAAAPPSQGFASTGDTHGLAVGDWNLDGAVDVYLSIINSEDVLHVNDGNGHFTPVTVSVGSGGEGVAMFDIENDGDVDVVALSDAAIGLVWRNSGGLVPLDAASTLGLQPSAGGAGLVAGDINADGALDLVMVGSGSVFVNQNARPGVPRSLLVRPLAASGAQSAFGATVRLECVADCTTAWAAARVIDGGSSAFGQNGYDAHFGVPAPSSTYNATVRWAGDFHPPSNWTTHPRLGGILPTTLLTPLDRLFVARPEAVRLSVAPSPWDVPGVGAIPAANDAHTIGIRVEPSQHTSDVRVVKAVVGGVDVADTWAFADGSVVVTHVTVAGEEGWPWTGLGVEIVVEDGGGMVSTLAQASVVVGSTWSEEASSRGMGDAEGVSACMGDVDGDGDVDVVMPVSGGVQLWVNNGLGSFVDSASSWGLLVENPTGCGFADVDGDGRLDLMLPSFHHANTLHMNRGGAFVEEAQSRGVDLASASLGVSWGDVDGDGDMDAFVCTSDNGVPDSLFINRGSGEFDDVGGDRLVLGGSSCYQGAVFDLDGDAHLDLFVVSSVAATVYMNDGSGGFSVDADARGFRSASNQRSIAFGDWNGDAFVDVYVASWAVQDVLYVNDGGGRFTGTALGMIGTHRGVSFLDIDLDGDGDVFVGVEGGHDVVWLQGGDGAAVEASSALHLGSSATQYGLAAGDIDGDGDEDVVTRASVYVNHNAQPGWTQGVTVRPLATSGAQSAFGAAVVLECVGACGGGGWVGLRVIDGGSGHFAQRAYDAVFGVPSAHATYNASVRWAGDFHPPSNWTTHPGLGGIMPGLGGVLVIRPAAVELAVGPSPWGGEAAPTPGSSFAVRVSAVGLAPALDLRVVRAVVGGEDVAASWTATVDGAYEVTYVTRAGEEGWPWTGLGVEVVVVDSGGLVSSTSLPSAVVGSTWGEESDTRGLVAAANAFGRGVCLGDVDGDGDVDVFAAVRSGDLNQLWINTGSGAFENRAAEWGADTVVDAVGCGFADVDGDEWVDLAVTGFTDNVNLLLINQGGGLLEDGDARGVRTGADSLGLSWGDVDGDSDVDLYISNNVITGNFLFMNDGGGFFTEDAADRGAQLPAALSQQSILVDIDRDWDLDILVSNAAAPNSVLVNDGDGSFVEDGASRGFDVAASSAALAVGDWNGDGMADVYVCTVYEYDVVLTNDGTGSFVRATLPMVAPTDSYGVSTFDLEGDGDVDIVVTASSLADVVWLNDGSGGCVDAAGALSLGSTATSTGLAAGDLDGDGDVDVVMGLTGDVFVNRNARPGLNRAVAVRPLTPSGAPSAFGAAVRLECVAGCASTWVGLRVLDGGGGYLSQAAYDAVFGVPAPAAAYNVSVQWVAGAPSNWTTHPRLGGITPAGLLSAADRLLIVRPAPARLAIGLPLPWDFAGVTVRTGSLAPPAAGDTVRIPVTAPPTALDLEAVSAVVNNQNLQGTFARDAGGGYSLLYTTVANQEAWPWSGLHVSLTTRDSGGLVSTLAATVVVGTTFEDVATSAGLGALDGLADALCMGDVDGDGGVDLVGVSSSGVQLFLNGGGGVFGEVPSALVGVSDPAACALADADGDSLLDVFVVPGAPGPNALFVQGGGGVFVDAGALRGVAGTDVTGGNAVAPGDVDGDGAIDMYVCDGGGANLLYVNNGTGFFASVSAAASTGGCRAAVLVDVDGDYDVDIVVANSPDASELFVNNGLGAFSERGAQRGFATAGAASGLVAADVTGDGFVDLFVARDGRDFLFVNDGSGFFTEEGLQRGLSATTATTSAAAALADADNDGDLDVFVVTGAGGAASTLWVNLGGGVFADGAAAYGLATDAPAFAAVGDVDGDGAVDIVTLPTQVLSSHNAQSGAWVVVRLFTAAGAPAAFGAAARLDCVAGCEGAPWSSVRVVGSASGGQNGHGLLFGLPVGGTAFDVVVTFVGGATHDKGTDERLGGVNGGTTLHVTDRPYLEGVAGVALRGGGGLLGVNDTVVVVLTAGKRRADLVPGPGCCLVNGVQVRDSFVGGGDGTYNLTYVLGEGEAVWGGGELTVVPTLESAGAGVAMVELVFGLEGVAGGDPVSPNVVFECRPGAASANVWEDVCVSCPGEDVCVFSYVVEATSLGRVAADVAAGEYTGGASARLRVGPFNDTDAVTLVVHAADAAGNQNASQALEWRVDTSSPVTTLVDTPDDVTVRTGATFTLQCSEPSCKFSYVFDGGPLTPLGANGTTGGAVPEVETWLQVAPGRMSNVTAPVVVFRVNASSAAMLVNARVAVGLGSRQWTLNVTGGVTEELRLPELGDGTYVLRGEGRGGDGVVDVTPVEYVFTVDTTPPTATIVDAPPDGDGFAQPMVVARASEADCVFLWRAGPVPLASPWQVAAAGVHRPHVTSGVEHRVEVRAQDAAGNVGEAVGASWTPVGCPADVPDVTIEESFGVGVGHRFVAIGGGGEVFEHRLDGGEWVQTMDRAVVVTDAELGVEHVLEVRAAVATVCNAGLAASRPPPHTVAWVEPAALPLEVEVLSAPDSFTPDVFAEFVLVGSRRLAWLEYSLDGAAWTPCGETLVLGPLQAGEHTMEVRAVDAGAGGSGVVRSHTWDIAAASDSSIVLTGLPDGVHTLTVVAEDDAGTVEVAPQTFTWRVDSTPPVVVGNRTSPRFTTSRTAVVDVACEGEVDLCVFCWTSPSLGANCSHTSPLLLTAPEDGEHVAEVRARDSVLLVSEGVVGVVWTVDSTPPNVSITDADGLFRAPLHATHSVDAVVAATDLRLTVTPSEAVAGYAVTVSGGEWPAAGAGLVPGPDLAFTGLLHIINNIVVAAVDLSGNVGEGALLRVLVDTTPPHATAFTAPPPGLTKESSVVVAVDCVDDVGGSGVRHVAMFVDGVGVGEVGGGAGVFTVAGLTPGVHNVSAAGVDVAGNVDPGPVWRLVAVDQAPPASSFVRPPPALTAADVLVVWVNATEPGEVFARVDGESGWRQANASGAVVFEGLPDGSHVVEAYAVDLAGNVEGPPYAAAGVAVDTTPPVTTVAAQGAGLPARPGVSVATRHTSVGVNVSASEAVAGYGVWVNGAQVQALAPGPVVVVGGLGEGVSNVSVAAVDLAGNVAASPSVLVVWVDVSPPHLIRVVSLPPSPTRAATMSMGVEAEDAAGGTGVSFMVVSVTRAGDGVAWPDVVVQGAAGTAVVDGLTTGVYNVSVVGVDAVGNAGTVPGVSLVVVDQVPPVSAFAATPPPFHASPVLAVDVEASEEAAVLGRVVGVTGWVPAGASGVVTFAGLLDGLNVVEARSVDVAGNNESAPFVTAEVVVDTVAPVLFWTQPPPAFVSDVRVTGCFGATDANAVMYSVGPSGVGQPSPTCFEVVGVGDGRAGVNVTGTDAAGNVGEVLGAEWVVDRVAPEAVVDAAVSTSAGCVHVGGGDTVCNAVGGAEVEVSCSDGGAGVGVEVSPCRVQYVVVLEEAAVGSGCVAVGGRRLAAGFEDAPEGSFVLEGGEGDGQYAVAVWGVDEAGNVEAGNVTMRWYVDTVVPVRPTFVQQPDGAVSTTTALFVVALEGDNSPGQTTFWHRLDDGVGAAVKDLPVDVDDDVQLELSGLASGNHKVEVWAVDQGGNVGPSVLHNWEIVSEAPSVVILEQPAAVSGDITPSFVFAARWGDRPAGNASEPLAGVEVSLNGAAEYTDVCTDTVESGGVCVWNASLAETGVGAYTVNVRARLVGNVGNPTPFAWQYTLCGDDQFAELGADGGISCVGCPVGGNCAGGLTGQADIAAVQGFWAPEGSSGLRFYECPVEEACLPGGEVVVGNETVRVVGQCAEGYTGTLCGVCEDGFFEQFGLCVSCGAESGVAWLIMFAVAVGVIGVGVLFFKFRDLMPIDQLKVTLSMVQIIASANTAYAIPWPPLFADFLNTMRVFLIEAVSLTRANCAQPMTFYGSLVVTLAGFKVVLAMVVLGPVVWHKCKQGGRGGQLTALRPQPQAGGGRRRRRSSVMQAMVTGAHLVQAVDWAKIFKVTFLFLFVAYPGVSLKVMTIFKCVEVEGDFWLAADMRLRCYEGDWFGYALYAAIMGCLYTGGLPLAITVILWRNRGKLGDEGVVRKWGFLYESYGVGAYLWEVEELVRKLWLSALVVLMAEGSPLQVTVAVLISGWAHVLHALYKPWRGVGEGGSYVYVLQHGSLLVTFFVFLMGLLFKVEGVSQDGETYNFLAWAMLLACVAFLIGAAFVLLAAGTALLRSQRRQRAVSGSAGGSGKPRSGSKPATSPSGARSPGAGAAVRAGATPRAVRASVLGGGLSWVGNPLRKEGKAGV